MNGSLPATDLLYVADAYRRSFESEVVAVDGGRGAVALAQTAFFPTGGGQPHDLGELRIGEQRLAVSDVVKDRDGVVWHVVGDGAARVAPGVAAGGEIDWTRRHLLMRLHTAQHIMNGLIWRDYEAHVTGAQISPPEARLDFELATMSQEFARSVETAVNEVIDSDLPVEVRWMPRSEADLDPSLMRLKADRIPRSIDPLRVIDIVGLDRQADGGTHVSSTSEVGPVRVVKTESKGKGNKRIRIGVDP